MYDVLVLDARLRQSLVLVRSLGRHGLSVAALESVQHPGNCIPAFSSRWCQRAYRAPVYDQQEELFVEYIEQIHNQIGVRMLVASSDETLGLLRTQRSKLERYATLALAAEPALSIAVDKEHTLAVAEQLGLLVPRGILIRAENELAAALREIRLPAVFKPTRSWVWSAEERRGRRLLCQLVTTIDEARSVLADLLWADSAVLVQQYLPGRREAISFLSARGEIYARFAQWARRTQPPLGGTSVLRQSIAVPSDSGSAAERFIREIELEGYAEVEFRRDQQGRPYLMEVNPRLSASVEVAVRSGVDFPYLLYQWASGARIERVVGYREGQWMRYLGGDIVALRETLAQRGRPGISTPLSALFDFSRSFLLPGRYDYVDSGDLLPVWIATSAFLRRGVHRIRKR